MSGLVESRILLWVSLVWFLLWTSVLVYITVTVNPWCAIAAILMSWGLPLVAFAYLKDEEVYR